MKALDQMYRRLAKQSFSDCDSVDEAIESIGTLIDLSTDLAKEEGLTHAITEAKQILVRDLNASFIILLGMLGLDLGH